MSAFPFDYSTLYRFDDFSPLLLLSLSLGDVTLFFSLSLLFSLSFFNLLYILSLLVAQFLPNISISNRFFSSISVRNFITRDVFYVHTCYRAVYFRSFILVSYVSIGEGCLYCADIASPVICQFVRGVEYPTNVWQILI